MQARPHTPFPTEGDIERAFAIALYYLTNTRDLVDAGATYEFIADALMQLLQRGERHPIRLANLSISAYERKFGRAPDRSHGITAVH
jgi:hypothetical protein